MAWTYRYRHISLILSNTSTQLSHRNTGPDSHCANACDPKPNPHPQTTHLYRLAGLEPLENGLGHLARGRGGAIGKCTRQVTAQLADKAHTWNCFFCSSSSRTSCERATHARTALKPMPSTTHLCRHARVLRSEEPSPRARCTSPKALRRSTARGTCKCGTGSACQHRGNREGRSHSLATKGVLKDKICWICVCCEWEPDRWRHDKLDGYHNGRNCESNRRACVPSLSALPTTTPKLSLHAITQRVGCTASKQKRVPTFSAPHRGNRKFFTTKKGFKFD